jgi:hypothetical protein
MCDKPACCTKEYLCHHCPTTPKPVDLNNGWVIRQQSAKMRLAQLLKIKGSATPANRHTSNLFGSKRALIPTDPSGIYWTCGNTLNR